MPKKRQNNRDSLLKARRAVSNKTMSVRKAAKEFGVPRSSIQYLIKNPQSKMKSGPNPILTTAEEEMLVEWIIDMAKRGFPRKKEDVQLCVQKFLVDNPRENPFIDNKPGNGWMKAFLKRNPILIPSAHQTHIPEEEDDLFLCHTCYEVEDESDESDEDLFNYVVHSKY